MRLARFAVIDATLQKLKRCREQVTPALARTCARFVELRGWKFMGAACLSDHSRESYDRTSRWVRELAAIGRGLEHLPGLAAAIAGHDLVVADDAEGPGPRPLGRTLAARVARVATPDSFDAWLALARRSTARAFADAVRAARAADSEFPLTATDASTVNDGVTGDGSENNDSRTGARHDGSGDAAGTVGASARSGGSDDDSRAGNTPSGAGHGGCSGATGWTDCNCISGGDSRAGAAAPGAGRGGPRAAEPADDPDEDEASDRKEVCLTVPGGVRLAFDEVLDLHRAVCGGAVPVSDLVEALIAEAANGVEPADDSAAGLEGVDCFGLRRGPSTAEVEDRLAGRAGGWSFLDRSRTPPAGKDPRRRSRADRVLDVTCERLVADAHASCARLEAVARRAGRGGAGELDLQIRELTRLDGTIERAIGELLGWISRYRFCLENLFNGVGHYAEERLGMSRRDAQLRARADRQLRKFPLLLEAYRSGELGVEAANVLLRILGPGPVGPEVEAAWLAHAREVRVKRLRDEARIAQRDWLENLGDPTPPLPADDDTWFRELARFPGTTRRRLGRIVEDARPSRRGVETLMRFTLRLPAELADRFAAVIHDRRRRALAGLDSAPAASRLAKMFSGLERVVPAWVGLLAVLEEYVDTWDDACALPRRRFDKVYALWGWRCAAPGCTRQANLEAHHLQYLAQGGPDALWNLVALCAFHHRQGEHGSLASCSGRGPLGILWRLGHLSVARWFTNERRFDGRTLVWRPACGAA